MTQEEIDAIDARWKIGGVICADPVSAKVALDAVADAQSVAGYAKVLLAENTRLRERLTREKEWAESELASQNEVGMKNLQELIQATGEIKALRATVEALHAILGKKEYEIQMLREKIAPLLSQEEKCT